MATSSTGQPEGEPNTYSLDHVALAVRTWAQAGPILAQRFGGVWLHGLENGAFRPSQLGYANNMRMELLEPSSDPASFITRYLDKPPAPAKPHHITFKVHDINKALQSAEQLGLEPILVNIEQENWKEAFLHPRDTKLGFLLQMAQAPSSIAEMVAGQAGLFPAPWDEPQVPRALLPFVHGRVQSWEGANAALGGLLEAEQEVVKVDQARGTKTVQYRWSLGAALVLTGPIGEVMEGEEGLDLLAFASEGGREWDIETLLYEADHADFAADLGLRVQHVDESHAH